MLDQSITGLVFGGDVQPEFRIARWGGFLCCVVLLILTILSRVLSAALFSGALTLLFIVYMSIDPRRVTYTLSEDGVMLRDGRTKFHCKNNKFVSWDKIRNGREVVATLPHGYMECAIGNYIVLQKKFGMIDHDCYGTRVNLNLLIRQPNAIPIPKTDQTVQFIEQHVTIRYLKDRGTVLLSADLKTEETGEPSSCPSLHPEQEIDGVIDEITKYAVPL